MFRILGFCPGIESEEGKGTSDENKIFFALSSLRTFKSELRKQIGLDLHG